MKVRRLFLYLSLLAPTSLYAQTLTQAQTLDLGTIVVMDNSQSSDVIMTKDGVQSRTNDIVVLRQGEPAIIEARDFDVNRRIYISVQALQSATTTTEFSPEQFTVVNYDVEPYIQTDALGSADIYVGGTFRTSGSGSKNFRDTAFNANYRLTVNY